MGRYDFFAEQLQECDQQIEAVMQQLQAHTRELAKGKKRSKSQNAPKFNLRERLLKMCGVDVTRIDGIDETTALNVVSEVGTDLSRFPSDKHFASWLGLCTGTRISGGKVLGSKTKPSENRAAQAGRQAAAALRSSKSALGAYYRRLCARMDKAKAVTAAAHKLARLFYALLTKARSTSTKASSTTRTATDSASSTSCSGELRVSAWPSYQQHDPRKLVPDQLLGRSFLRGRACGAAHCELHVALLLVAGEGRLGQRGQFLEQLRVARCEVEAGLALHSCL